MRHNFRLIICVAAFFTSMCCVLDPAPARCDPFFLDESVFGKLSKEDIDLLKQTVTKANDVGQLNIPLEWKNPSTGNGGTVTLVEHLHEAQIVKKQEFHNCNRVKSEYYIKDQRADTTFTWCQMEDRSWKVLK